MKIYAEYIKEIAGIEVVFSEEFFYTYKLEDDYLYLQDVYITKNLRKSGLMDRILEDVYSIAKCEDKAMVTSSICKNATEEVKNRSHYILTKHLFKLYNEDDNMKYYYKEIS